MLFAAAISPLSPRDFYQTFRENLAQTPESAEKADFLIAEAQKIQSARPDILPSSALLTAADENNVELRNITKLPDAHDNSECISMLRKKAAGSIRLGLDLNGGVEFVLKLNPDYDSLITGGTTREEAEKKLNENFQQYRDVAMEALRKRLESQNIFESEITPFGKQGLSLKAPIVSKDEKDKLQKLIQMSSKLQFRLVHPQSAELLAAGKTSQVGYERLAEVSDRKGKDAQQNVYLVARRSEMDGKGIDQAFVSRNEFGRISIALRFNSEGAKKFAEITGRNIGRQLAIVLDGRLYCAPVIQSEITGGQAEISGQFSLEEAQLIADALTNGSFPFKIDVEGVYDTDPTLGADNVRNGIWAGLAALALLMLFMTIYYRRAGVIACAALIVNVVLILGAMATFGATMTMPGIAGIILTLGMAVDANVLVFERIREEKEAGKGCRTTVELGFQKAYSSVIDGNLTTLVVALILMYFGTGAIKGFAVSLSIGIICSLFTALFMSRVIFDWLDKISSKPFGMLRFFAKPSIDFIRQSKAAMLVSGAAIILSIAVFCIKGENMLAVDFTGGTLLSYNYRKNVPVADLEKSLLAAGISGKVTYKSNASAADNRKVEVLIRENRAGEITAGSGSLNAKVTAALNKAYPQLALSDGQVTAIGAMVGSEMTRNALISIVLAFVGMIIYVTVRFELNYAAAGIITLVHDVIVSLGIYIACGRELTLPVVAGVLTIIGYSINDTIVIFDRIREEQKLHPERSFADTVNYALNSTLSRTILTSLTTFIVVAVMFLFGGIAINDFMFIIMLGIVAGSYSSLYIAAPMVVMWRKFRDGRHHSGRRSADARP